MSSSYLFFKPLSAIKQSIHNIHNFISYLSGELNYIYMSSNEPTNAFEYTEFELSPSTYPNTTDKYSSILNDNDKNGWGFHIYIED